MLRRLRAVRRMQIRFRLSLLCALLDEQADRRAEKGGEVGMNFTEEEVYAIFAFIRNHEIEDIPEDVWDISERIYEWMYENS